MKNKMKWLSMLLLTLMLFALNGCGKQAEEASNAPGVVGDQTEVIAEVDGTAITRGDLTKRVDMLATSMAMQYGVEINRTDFADFYESMKEVAFDDLELGILLDNEAEKEGFKVEEAELAEYIGQIGDYAESIGKTKEEYLAIICATEEDLRMEYSRNAFINSKRDEFYAANEVTEEEISEYYNEFTDEFVTEAGIEISHILVDTEEEANQIIADLQGGADFAALASEKSKDSASAVQGGNLGLVNEKTNFVEEFKTAALALNPGEYTETPVKSDYGYHIIKAGERVEESVTSLEDAHDYIADTLKGNKAQAALEEYAQNLKDNATVNDMRQDIDFPQISEENAPAENNANAEDSTQK